jgi:hypothetical protein
MLMNDQLPMWLRATSPDTPNVTSSPESVVGAGPTNAPCGPARPRASLSASQVKAQGSMMSGTYGLSSIDSSPHAAPLSSWESRLRQRLEKIGSTVCSLTWKQTTTPVGRSLSRLAASVRRIDGIGYGLLPTPSGTSNHGRNHVSGRLDEWGGNSNPFRGTEDGKLHCAPFELWMMGFSDAWRQQMPREMPSSRKSRRK